MAGQPGRVVIVGAGPAGMALAYLLARRGAGVTVLETHHDFARAFRGEGLQRSGIDAIRQMGLGEQFDHLPYIELGTIEMYSGGRLVVRTAAAGLGVRQTRWCRSRRCCNCWPTRPASTPPSASRSASPCATSCADNGRVVGVRASAADGPREYRADLVVGADGRHAATPQAQWAPRNLRPARGLRHPLAQGPIPRRLSRPERPCCSRGRPTAPAWPSHGRRSAPGRLRDPQRRLRRPSRPRCGGMDGGADRRVFRPTWPTISASTGRWWRAPRC